jgi:hypothetical protein
MVISIPISLAGSIPMKIDASFSANSQVLSMAKAVLAGIEESRQAVAFIAASHAALLLLLPFVLTFDRVG